MSVIGQITLDSSTSTFEFRPDDIKFYLNTTVNWTVTGQGTHTITATDGSFEGENLKDGDECLVSIRLGDFHDINTIQIG